MADLSLTYFAHFPHGNAKKKKKKKKDASIKGKC